MSSSSPSALLCTTSASQRFADQQLDRFPLLLGSVKTITHQEVHPCSTATVATP